ncbi:MAG: hypothetical protein RR398_05960 [Clostridia bacterium]
MKNAMKVIFAVSMIMILAMSLAACKPATPKPSDSPATEKGFYRNDIFTFKEPDSWREKYEVEENNNSFGFTQKNKSPIYDLLDSKDIGAICCIWSVAEGTALKDPDAKILKTKDGMTYILSYGNFCATEAENKKMLADFDLIVATFDFVTK